jgi:hypothetical protein
MPRMTKLRPGAVGLAFTVWDIWRRLPAKQRRQMLTAARKHGPRAASKLYQLQREARAKRR